MESAVKRGNGADINKSKGTSDKSFPKEFFGH